MALGYGLPEGHVFLPGQRLNVPIGEDFEPYAARVVAVLPWQGEPDALVLWHYESNPKSPHVTYASHALDWWLPESTLPDATNEKEAQT